MITFETPKTVTSKTVSVILNIKLDGKKVGVIKKINGKYQYFPSGKNSGGEIFETLDACKQSLK